MFILLSILDGESLYSDYPRFCAACGRLNMVNPDSSYDGEVCGKACAQILGARRAAATLGVTFDEKRDHDSCTRGNVRPLPRKLATNTDKGPFLHCHE